MIRNHHLPTALFILIILFIYFSFPIITLGASTPETTLPQPITLSLDMERKDVYTGLSLLGDNEREYELEEVVSDEFLAKFVPANDLKQRGGFFEAHKWLRFEVENPTDVDEWILEFAFPQIFHLELYEKTEGGLVKLYKGGAQYPFAHREIAHRNFIFNLEVNPGDKTVYYAIASGGGDLHPPINLWEKDAFVEKTQMEFTLLGIFYGMIVVMVFYNLFLYFGLRLKSYLYYVIIITFSLLGKLSINGLGYQYLWPNHPQWNLVSTPVWVSLACIFILIFTRTFLDVDEYLPKYKNIAYGLMGLNALVIVSLLFSYYFALNLMLVTTMLTFATVLITALICLGRGARQARFFIVGWIIFLHGVFITILERAAILPFTIVTEYAGQAALTIEVVLLSLALADKFKIIQEEKEQAEELARENQTLALENLKKADELKDEFLAITSHELRTPLYGMVGIAESLRDGVAGEVTPNMREQLNMVINSGNRLTHLVNDILDFSQLKHETLELSREAVHLRGVADIVCAICKPLIKTKPVKLVNKIESNLPAIYGDPNRLQQIFYNLIGNAIQYTVAGEITMSATLVGKYVRVSVSDTGKGISREEQEQIFEPFQQLDASLSRSVGGVGIGLNITKRLVDLHDGKIELESEKGKGTAFHVFLPIHKGEVKHIEQEEEAALALDTYEETESIVTIPNYYVKQKAKVIIADDEPVNLQVLMNKLSLEGYDIFTALNGEQVLAIMEREVIDLVILDIMMPNMSGYEVCRRLREKYTLMELPILMLTAKNQLHDIVASFEAGANDYLVKPCDKQELLARVKTLVEVRTLNQELMAMNLHLEDKVQERTDALAKANEELKVKNNDLIEMAASRRHLLANIAHELGTPVTTIYGYLQALHEGLISLEEDPYRERVYEKIKLLNRLIDDLADLSHLEAGKGKLTLKGVNVEQWLMGIVEKFMFEVSQGERKIEVNGNPRTYQGYTAHLDVERMDQVFSNLISNAIKHTSSEKGAISLKLSMTEEERLLLEVKDNGRGINEANLPFIFERFYKGRTTNEETPAGTGLGLAITKEIVQRHDGDIWAKSQEGNGTAIYVELPVYR